MSSGFLLANALSEVLRRPYHKADMAITVNYLVEGIKIGDYRVMLKRDFDTACWVPPVGKRTSHSIYYGDRMVARVLERFVSVHEIEMPDPKVLTDEIKVTLAEEKAALEAAKEARAAAVAAKKRSIPIPVANPMSVRTRLLDAQLNWLHENVDEEVWALFGEWLHKAIMSYGRHERSHARHTPQDMKQVNRDLRMLSIPFSYFNLFEDARIEHLDRQDQDMPFEWMMFEELASLDSPMSMFLRCIQFEGEPDVVALESEEPFKGDATRTVGSVADAVQTYYKRACDCSTAEHLYQVITDFLEEFKDDLPPPPKGEEGEGEGEGGSGSGGSPSGKKSGKKAPPGEGDGDADEEDSGAGERAGDLSTAAEAADKGDEFFEEFDSDAEIVGGTDPEGKAAEDAAKEAMKPKTVGRPGKAGGASAEDLAGTVDATSVGGRGSERDFLAYSAGAMDDTYRKRVDNLIGMLMRMFKSHTLPAALESQGQRMSGRHLAHGELRWLHKRVFGGKGKRKFTVVYDCSGSMGGRPDREGKVLLLALNALAKRGFLEGSLILSGYVDGTPSWMQYELPVRDEIILRINPSHGAEGLQTALKDNMKHIKNVDDVFVVTDANICDSPINRGMFAKERVWPVGLYVGDKSAAPTMEKHFPQNIIRDTIEQVVEAMMTRNRRTVG
jgi:hypothetical protein